MGPYIIGYKDADYTGAWRVKTPHTYKTYHKHFLGSVQQLVEQFDEVFVCRKRRGQWGEWCETWRNVNGKATIIKQGWS